MSKYELRVLQDFEDDFAKDRSRSTAKLQWGALALVLLAVVVAACLIGALASALAGTVIGPVGVLACGGVAWWLHRRRARRHSTC